MMLSLFLVYAVALVLSTALLVALGHRLRVASGLGAVLYGFALAVGSGEIAGRVWDLEPQGVLAAQALLMVMVVVVVALRPAWNPLGQVFFATFLSAALAYLAFAAVLTVTSGLSPLLVLASLLLFGMELLALSIGAYFVFEGCDVLCRARSTRKAPRFDPAHQPMVSLQVAAYNEPPEMLIETIRSLEAIDYPNFEVLVIDNNTEDPDTWRPVEEYCAGRPRVRFLHVEGLQGFKAGALNLVLREHMHPDAEIIGVIDADYRVDPSWLREVVGHFADPKVAFVQTPQEYREWEGDPYLTACYDAYEYFFAVSMPSRNERNAIIFAGTMGLIRRSALEEVGGWPEWCITEDAETSLRILRAGYEGWYVPKKYGAGIMPLTFSSFKSQRFRWAFGGIQIMRRHLRSLLPGRRTADNRLTFSQRLDYLMSGVLWFNDLLQLGFSAVLLAGFVLIWTTGDLGIRPLRGAVVFLPAALIASGIVRALWGLRVRTGIGIGRGMMAFANWLSLSWTVALAVMQHLVTSKVAFLRTPKEEEARGVASALRATKLETAFAVLIWSGALALAVTGRGSAWIIALLGWQGIVYASAPFMAYLNARTKLSPELEARRRSESRRERAAAALLPAAAGASAGVVAAAIIGLLVAGGATNEGRAPALFERPEPSRGGSPFEYVVDRVRDEVAPSEPPAASEAPVASEPVVPPPSEAPPEPTPAPVIVTPAPEPATPAPAESTPAP